MCVIVNSGNQLTIIVILDWCTESLKTGNRTCSSAEVFDWTEVRAPHVKRRLEIAPSVLAKKVAEGHDKSSTQLAEQLGTEYSWTSEERRQKVNAIRGMRAMER